jgi:hypothetical protein
MKKFTIPFRDCGVDGFEFLKSASSAIDIVKDGMEFWLCDIATGYRILSQGDILEISVTEEQETVLRLRFGDKISESV